MPARRPHPLIIWRLTDGKPGHEKQTLGLAQALARITISETHEIRVEPGPGQLLNALLGRFPAGKALPAPHLILAAGHATHLPLLAARGAHGGKAIVLMKPSLPLGWFDLCLIPEHDFPPCKDNVITTLGVLNTLTDSKRHDPACGLMLIGGPSPHFLWNSAAIHQQIRELVGENPDLRWTLTTSRRTPEHFLDPLRQDPRIECLPADTTPPGWLEEQLARSGEAWCTPDSVSMVYEALTAGCRVGLLRLPAMAGSRVAAGVAKLEMDGYISAVRRKPESIDGIAPPPPINESERCAGHILEKWFS